MWNPHVPLSRGGVRVLAQMQWLEPFSPCRLLRPDPEDAPEASGPRGPARGDDRELPLCPDRCPGGAGAVETEAQLFLHASPLGIV